MRKSIRKFIALILCIPFAFSFNLNLFASGVNDVSSAKLYRIYDDNMLFKHSTDAVFAGEATPGSAVECRLVNSDGETIREGNSVVGSDGKFTVSFIAPEGSFENYSVVLSENGGVFKELRNVAFGELWLASGQSNMDMPLGQTALGSQMQKNAEKGSEWMRFLLVPSLAEYNGSEENIPLYPQDDVAGSEWFDGTDNSIYSFSGVAYFFAQELYKKLDMPLGIVQSSLGGTSIRSWISKEAIDSDADVRNILQSRNEYISAEEWDSISHNHFLDMSGNYNKKIAPLRHFRPSGMIWYQGESDIMLQAKSGEYSKQLDLLQRSYSELFTCDGLLPLIFTQVTPYGYSSDFSMQKFNIELSEFQAENEQKRALVTVHDIPLTYTSEIHAIHPLTKFPIGQRMAFCADGLVYGKHTDFSAPSFEKAEISGNEIIITFRNTGNGLVSDGKELKGFAICSQNGIYLPAKAEIISENTVRVYNSSIESPLSVTYGITQSNCRSNLFANLDGFRMPASPFISDKNYDRQFWKDSGWTDCDSEQIWRTHTNELSGFYPVWKSENSSLEISGSSAFSGEGGISLISENRKFSASPLLHNPNGQLFFDVSNDFSSFTTLSFRIRNNSSDEIRFSNLELVGKLLSCSPIVSDSNVCGAVIPADGQWYTVTLDLTQLRLFATPFIFAPGNISGDFKDIRLNFENENGGLADIDIDEFDFSSSKTDFSSGSSIRAFFDEFARFFAIIFRIQN